MNSVELDDSCVSPLLLRPEAFANPGAIDWLRTGKTANPRGTWLTVIGCALGLLTLALFVSLTTHSQVRSYSARLFQGNGRRQCTMDGGHCYLRIVLNKAPADPSDFAPGSRVAILLNQHRLGAEVVSTTDGDITLMVTRPVVDELRAERLTIQTLERRSLSGWILRDQHAHAGTKP